jgi:hypothetical protein
MIWLEFTVKKLLASESEAINGRLSFAAGGSIAYPMRNEGHMVFE